LVVCFADADFSADGLEEEEEAECEAAADEAPSPEVAESASADDDGPGAADGVEPVAAQPASVAAASPAVRATAMDLLDRVTTARISDATKGTPKTAHEPSSPLTTSSNVVAVASR
jgi:hypothetical protein